MILYLIVNCLEHPLLRALIKWYLCELSMFNKWQAKLY
jgi:hypothetical protein